MKGEQFQERMTKHQIGQMVKKQVDEGKINKKVISDNREQLKFERLK